MAHTTYTFFVPEIKLWEKLDLPSYCRRQKETNTKGFKRSPGKAVKEGGRAEATNWQGEKD